MRNFWLEMETVENGCVFIATCIGDTWTNKYFHAHADKEIIVLLGTEKCFYLWYMIGMGRLAG